MREKKVEPVEAAEIFLRLLTSPAMRAVFKLASMRCPRDGQRSIEYALDDYIGKKRSTCVTCDWFAKIVALAIRNGETASGVKRALEEPRISSTQNPETRRVSFPTISKKEAVIEG